MIFGEFTVHQLLGQILRLRRVRLRSGFAVMDFNPLPPPADANEPAEPGVMHIGGSRGRRVWEITRWFLLIAAVAAVLVVFFIRFGATTLWAFGLVGFMIGYMALMGKWAGGDNRR
jgi:hypothetical protein